MLETPSWAVVTGSAAFSINPITSSFTSCYESQVINM